MATFPTKPDPYSPYAAPADDTTKADDAAVAGSTVNVSPFSWTSNDLTSVKDIITYVRTAQTASQSADKNASYVQGMVDSIANMVSGVDTAKDTALSTFAAIQTLGNNISSGAIDINAKVLAAQQAKDDASGFATQAAQAKQDTINNALASIYRFKDNGVVGSSFVITPANGSVQHVTLNQGTTTISLGGLSADLANTARQITVIFKQGTGANRVNWPQGTPDPQDTQPIIMWNGGREPVFSYVKDMEDVVTLLTTDKGVHWMGFYNGGWFNTSPLTP